MEASLQLELRTMTARAAIAATSKYTFGTGPAGHKEVQTLIEKQHLVGLVVRCL